MSKKKEKKKSGITIALICIIVLVIAIICVIIGKLKKPKREIITEENIISKIEGEWGRCTIDDGCDGIIISKGEDEKYYYNNYIMWSEFSEAGVIEKVEQHNDLQFSLTVHYNGYESEEVTVLKTTDIIELDITDVYNNRLYVGDKEYQKISGDRESFYEAMRENR